MFGKIMRWQQSGLSQKVYCEQHNIRYHIFHYWYKRYRQQQEPSAAKENPFIALHLQPSAAATSSLVCMELVFADGKRLLFYQAVSADYLKALVS